MMKSKLQVRQICFVAFAIVINIVGGQIALMFRLPIYLDSIGTFFVAAYEGPILAMLPSLLSGLIFGFTSDIYALYFAPVGILLGLLSGLILKNRKQYKGELFISALLISLPTSLLSAFISSYLFGGITSSGASYLVQLLAKTPLGLTFSCFIVQFITDYLDRLLSLVIIQEVMKKMPRNFKK